ncbi:Tetratricopeptide-like helical domain containing protein [Parasponia andersonii]|uniref:Tetratricopeptide-like helical domain containing protein n=1 Tax=Parasponia andersonii TaxID=3476 RepID=A0A2P5D6L4_PARAD|nr:Tetratricopeptide-like helical domain containing protein [Parasponia andersonii]
MRFLKKFPCFQTGVITKLIAFCHLPKAQLHTHLKPPKANQKLDSYLQSNYPTKALLLFREILRKSVSTIDSYSLLYVLKASTQKSSSIEGKQSHALVIKFGFEAFLHLQTSLLHLYSSTSNLMDAHQVFDEMRSKNVVCWTALISAYVDNQKPNKALQLFRQMQMDNLEPDEVTVTVALSACTDLGALETGEWIHAYVRSKTGFSKDLSLKNALINMYAKCGDVKAARRLFDSLRKKDVTTWTSMIVGHALHGQGEEALKLFEEMKETSKSIRSPLINPNDVTFLGVLMSCSHTGLVEEGKQHFRSMIKDYDLKPREPHFGCMVDLYCRAGLIEEAYDFVSKMPVRMNSVVWRTLLSACALNGNVELGTQVRQKLMELEPTHVGDSVALSNIYAAKGMWDMKMSVRGQIKQRRAPGCSSIEVRGSGIGQFVAADDDHPLRSEIYEVLKSLVVSMKDAYGYSTVTLFLEE